MNIAEAIVEIIADGKRFTASFRNQVGKAGAEAGRQFDAGFEKATAQTGAKVSRDVNGRLRDERGRFLSGGAQAGTTWGDAFRNALAFKLASGAISKIFAPLNALGRGLGLAVAGAGAAAAAAQLLTFVGVAGQTAGVLLAIPAAALVGAAALSTLRVATSGMSDAFAAAASGDPKKLAEALKQLSPAARSVVGEFAELVPQLNAVRTAVQDAFFDQLQGQLTAVAANLAGPVQSGMVGTAAAAGAVALGIARIAQQAETAQLVSGVFDTAAGSIANLEPGLLAIVTGFRDLGGVALPLVGQLSQGIGGLAVQFGTWLSSIAGSGQALTWIQTAVGTLRQLGDLLTQVGGIFATIFGAAQTTGGGLLGTLTELLRGVNAFLSSGEGQSALQAVFLALQEVGGALGPVLGSLLSALGQLAGPAAALAVALGPGISAALRALGPAIAALGPGLEVVAKGLADALANPDVAAGLLSLGQGLSATLAALGPLMPVLGQLVAVIGNALGRSLQVVAPILQKVAEALAWLLPPIISLIDKAQALVTAFVGWAYLDVLPAVLGRIGDAAAAVGRWFAGLWDTLTGFSWSDVTSAIGDAAAGIGGFFSGLGSTVLGALRGVASGVADWASGLASSAGSGVSDFVGSVVDWFAALPARIGAALAALPGQLWQLLVNALTFAATAVGYGIGAVLAAIVLLPQLIANVLVGLGQLLWNVLTAAWTYATTAVVTGLAAIVTWSIGLPARIIAGLQTLGEQLSAWASNAWTAGLNATVAAAAAIVSWAIGLPGQITGAVQGLAGQLSAWASNAWTAGLNATVAAAAAIVSWAIGLPGQITGAVQGLAGQLSAWGRNAWNSAYQGTVGAVGELISYVSGIGGRIVSAVGDLGGRLVAAGRAIISGLLSGIRQGAQEVFDFVSGIGDRIASLKGPLPYDKVLLIPNGKALMTGLDVGLRRGWPQVEATLRRMTADLPSTVPVRLAGKRPAPQLQRAPMTRNGVTLTPQQVPRSTTTIDNSRTITATIPITTRAENPLIVARRAADELALLGQG